ncbi:hypothetical protein RFI_30012, partial [Reticulomyxa filosa]
KNAQEYLKCIHCQTPKPIQRRPVLRFFLFNSLTLELVLTPFFIKKSSSIPWKNTENFDCIIAIDFGTEGTAMGINMKKSKGVHLITDWNSNGISDRAELNGKTKTALLLDENHNVIAFGNEAWHQYQSPNNKDTNQRLLFHRFKMYLYDVAGQYQTNKQSTIKQELQSMNGVNVKSETVFVGALKYCKQKAMQYLEQNNLIVNENKIQWAITVPAIWSEEAKGIMKQWAKQATLWNSSIPNQLIIALEPECASVCMMLAMRDNQSGIQFKTGDCYMMMDLGAGTADMVCHEITGPFQVREMIASFGGPWGGSYIDHDVETIFKQIFGEEAMKKFQKTFPKDYLKLLADIEDSKQRFFKIQKKNGVHRIPIPYEFDQFMQKNIIGELEELVAKFEYLGESGHEYDHEYLSLSCKLWTKLFDIRIDPIIKKMNEMLNKNEKILSGKLKYICLVGGFSQSHYLQSKLKQHYEPKYTFVIPQRPVLSVIEGAAQLARIPSFITSRIVKYTYGNNICWPTERAQSHPEISEDHINKYKFISDTDNEEYVSNCFDVFVNKNEEVKVGQVNILIFVAINCYMIEMSYTPASKNNKDTCVSIYRSEKIDPGVITKCKRLGNIKVPFPEDFDNLKDSYDVRFYFGETMIRVTVTIKGKEYVEHEVHIKFDFNI